MLESDEIGKIKTGGQLERVHAKLPLWQSAEFWGHRQFYLSKERGHLGAKSRLEKLNIVLEHDVASSRNGRRTQRGS